VYVRAKLTHGRIEECIERLFDHQLDYGDRTEAPPTVLRA